MPFFPDPVGALSGIDPQTMGLLSAASAGLEASGPSRMPVSLGQVFGRALGAGLGGYTQGVQTQQANTLRNLQMRQLQESMAATDQKRKAIQDYAMSLPDAQRTMFLADPEKFLAAQAKAMEPFSLKPGEQRFMNGQPIAAAPESFTLSPGQQRFTGGQAGPSMPANPQLVDVPVPGQPGVTQPTWLRPGEASGTGLGFKVPEILNPDVQKARVGIARAGASNVTVQPDNLGLKPKDRFDMEDKLRNDFQANPIVKAADEMSAAFRLIDTAKKNPSPANDLAMATKYMKILDPGSVVRESELAMAMGAAGLMDRVQNYAQMVISGNKLTPRQREDFYNSAQEINKAFQGEKGKIASRFTGNATQYNLNPENVVGRSATTFDKMPPAVQLKGKIIRDTDTGKLFKSDGMSWKEVQ